MSAVGVGCMCMFLPLAFQQVHWLTGNSDYASSDVMLLGLARNKEHYMHIVCIHSICQYTQRSRVEKRIIIRDEPFKQHRIQYHTMQYEYPIFC